MGHPTQPGTELPNQLIDPDEARYIKERWLEGWSMQEILDDAGLEFVTPHRELGTYGRSLLRDKWRRNIKKFLKDPQRWDPDIDEQAVYRAFMGDQNVWLNLTHYEREQVMRMLIEVYEGGIHRRWPDMPGVEAVHEWAHRVGEHPGRIADVAGKRERRARDAA